MVTIAEKKAAKEEKRVARLKIANLHEKHCSGCRDPKKTVSKYCNETCEFGKQIRHLGNVLDGNTGKTWTGGEGVEIPKLLKPSKENYLNLKEANVSDKKIAKIFEISPSSLGDRKIEWGVNGVTLRPNLTKTLQEKDSVTAPAPVKEKKPIGRPRKNPAPSDPFIGIADLTSAPAPLDESISVAAEKIHQISLEKMAKAAEVASGKVESVFTPEQKKVISMVKYQELESILERTERERDELKKDVTISLDNFQGMKQKNEELFRELQLQDQELLKCTEIITNFQILAKVAIEAISSNKELQGKYDNLVKLYQHGEDTKDRMIRDAAEQIRNLEAVLLDYLPDPQ